MDRRDFLKTTSAAAVAAGAAASAAQASAATDTAAAQAAAPAILSGIRQLTLASFHGPDVPGAGADRLVRRIETATDGRYRIVAAVADAVADMSYRTPYLHGMPQRALAYFGGLPVSLGLDTASLQTWLAVGGGAMLWDELAAELGTKPLLAGHTGPSPGVWTSARLDSATDFAGMRVHVDGLAGDVVRSLGATPARYLSDSLAAALVDGRLQAAEWLGPLAAIAPDLQPLAQRLYQPSFNRNGLLLSLNIAKPLWDGMSAADRAIFEGCAAQEYQLSLADAQAHAMIAAQVETPGKWPVRLAWSAELGTALEDAAAETVERIAEIDPASRRIHDSYLAFRRLLGEPPTA